MGEPCRNAGGLSFPWRQNADLTWSYAPDVDGVAPVRLSADTEPDDPWHVPGAEALAESEDWRDYVAAEVAYYVARLDEIG